MHERTKPNVDIAIFFLWVFVITAMGTFLMVAVIWQIIVTTGKTASTDDASVKSDGGGFSSKALASMKAFLKRTGKKLKVLKTSLAFVMMFLGVWTIVFAYRGMAYVKTPHAKASYKEWLTCVFKNSVSSAADSAWEGACGKHAKYR
jgi:uncharacterized membrane protein